MYIMYIMCSLNIMFFPRIFESLPPLPCQHSAVIGCTKNYQPIGVNCEKTQFFLNTLYVIWFDIDVV